MRAQGSLVLLSWCWVLEKAGEGLWRKRRQGYGKEQFYWLY